MAWARDDVVAGHELAEQAIEQWGAWNEHLGTEFAWLAVWPLAACALVRGDLDGATRAVAHLAAPHERPMPEPLRATVGRILEPAPGGDVEALLHRARDEAMAAQLL